MTEVPLYLLVQILFPPSLFYYLILLRLIFTFSQEYILSLIWGQYLPFESLILRLIFTFGLKSILLKFQFRNSPSSTGMSFCLVAKFDRLGLLKVNHRFLIRNMYNPRVIIWIVINKYNFSRWRSPITL